MLLSDGLDDEADIVDADHRDGLDDEESDDPVGIISTGAGRMTAREMRPAEGGYNVSQVITSQLTLCELRRIPRRTCAGGFDADGRRGSVQENDRTSVSELVVG